MKKRILSVLLALALCLSLCPSWALAASGVEVILNFRDRDLITLESGKDYTASYGIGEMPAGTGELTFKDNVLTMRENIRMTYMSCSVNNGTLTITGDEGTSFMCDGFLSMTNASVILAGSVFLFNAISGGRLETAEGYSGNIRLSVVDKTGLNLKTTGDVTIDSSVDTGGSSVNISAKNVTISGDTRSCAFDDSIRDITISATGTVAINADSYVTKGNLTIIGAKEVRISGNTSEHVVNNLTLKNCGDVLISNNGSGDAVSKITADAPVVLSQGSSLKLLRPDGKTFNCYGNLNASGNVPLYFYGDDPICYKSGTDGWIYYESTGNGSCILTLENFQYSGLISTDEATTLEIKGSNIVNADISCDDKLTVTGSGTLSGPLIDVHGAFTNNSNAALNVLVKEEVSDVLHYIAYGDVTLKQNLTLDGTQKLTVSPGAALTMYQLDIADPSCINNQGTIDASNIKLTGSAAEGDVSQTIKNLKLLPDRWVFVSPSDGSTLLYTSSGLPVNYEKLNFASEDAVGAGYEWIAETSTLILKDAMFIGGIYLPSGAVTVKTEGTVIINDMMFSGSDNTQVTFSGSGQLTVNYPISVSGDNSGLTVAEGASLDARYGVSAGTNGVNGTITVNGTLTAVNDSGNAVSAGKVIVGSSGTLEVSGANGVVLGGMRPSSSDPIDFTNAFTLDAGGTLAAACTNTVITVSVGQNFPEADVSKVINVPASYLPKGCEVKLNDQGVIVIEASPSSGSIVINSTNAPSAPLVPPSYPVQTAPVENGTVTVSPDNAAPGATVTVTVTPDEGYALDELTVTDSQGNTTALTDQGDGTYIFTMPSQAVTVNAAFAPQTDPCDGGAGCPSHTFADLDANAWYHEAVDYVLENGLMNGYGNGNFGPNSGLSRAMLAQILYNKAGNPSVTGGSIFSDTAIGQWYTPAITWAAKNGIVNGYGNGKFGPNDSITREQVAVMLWRYAGSPAATDRELHFTDAGEASGYALEALLWAAEHGILNGYGDGRLNPRGVVTRAQTAQILKNFMGN